MITTQMKLTGSKRNISVNNWIASRVACGLMASSLYNFACFFDNFNTATRLAVRGSVTALKNEEEANFGKSTLKPKEISIFVAKVSDLFFLLSVK
uniref:Uncharacterized protein n=1 Tax=Romanomermis culicivorax TaxID=13658 RepID=A0A915KCD9_ROMCU